MIELTIFLHLNLYLNMFNTSNSFYFIDSI